MLRELRVENLLLIEQAQLRLAPGLNVLTGETGAGKTVLAHALDLLLGGKAKQSIVRPGAAEAYVEGVFDLPDQLRDELADRLAPDATELILARRVTAEGRTKAYLNGRSATVADLSTIGGSLIAFYGQHEHRKLTLASAQLEILDDACGPEQRDRRALFGTQWNALRAIEDSLIALRESASTRERDLGLLDYELAEIDEVSPSEDEETSLGAERDRLRNLDGLRRAAQVGVETLLGDSGATSVTTLLATAASEAEAVVGADSRLDELAARLVAARYEAEDIGADLRRYGEEIEAVPGRLEEVQERLASIESLKRKHGGSVASVLEHARVCRERRDVLSGAEIALGSASAELEAAASELEITAKLLTDARRSAAPILAQGVRERLAELAMQSAQFEVALIPRSERGPSGDESVEFRIAPNPGVPAGPLREVGSGGELSRVMLALTGVAADAGGSRSDASLLVFDEIDAGIGGHTARAVGERLRSLSGGRQLLCITHLPQVASLAERHFRIAKDTTQSLATATVETLNKAELVSELVRMLGADETDRAARLHAQELLKAA
ncbi:MAG: DNA repair protein RecN [Actinomycetota bacterium]